MNFTWQNEHITSIYRVASEREKPGVFILIKVHLPLNSAIRENNQTERTPLAFLFLYILMSPIPNISHWEGTCMQTSSFSFINDDLQIKPFGARSWHFPKQPVQSRGPGPCLWQAGARSSLEWSWRCILVKLWQLPNGRLHRDIVLWLLGMREQVTFWVGWIIFICRCLSLLMLEARA